MAVLLFVVLLTIILIVVVLVPDIKNTPMGQYIKERQSCLDRNGIVFEGPTGLYKGCLISGTGAP
jgi:hypothetical protein